MFHKTKTKRMKTIKLKSLLALAPAAIMLFSACADKDDFAPVSQMSGNADNNAVNFSVYTKSNKGTRAGFAGEIGIDQLRATGFGVFAYVAPKNGSKDEFDYMYNQRVMYGDTSWVYSPLKYWPNNEDSVTFFAYAPYVDSLSVKTYKNSQLDPDDKFWQDWKNSGTDTIGKSGILAFTSSYGLENTGNSGNVKIAYKVSDDPAKAVDLLYGVAAREYTEGPTNRPAIGYSPLILDKRNANDGVFWEFKHALTKFGITVDAIADSLGELAPNTRILIGNISLSSSSTNLYRKGTLSLGTSSVDRPNWRVVADSKVFNGEIDSTQFAKGLRYTYDDKHFNSNGDRNSNSADKAAGLAWFNKLPMGVTTNPQNLFGYYSDGNNDGTNMFIPDPDGNYKLDGTITIRYHVITRDPSLPLGYSDVQNTISATIPETELAPGYKNQLRLHLGLRSVNMEAYVMDWNDSVMASVALPKNVTATSIPSISIGSDGKVNCSGTINLSDGTSITAQADMFAYALCSLDGKDSVTVGATKLDGSYYIPVAYNDRDVKYSYGGITERTSQPSGSVKCEDQGTIISSDLLQIEVEATAWDFNWTGWYFYDYWANGRVLEIVSHEPIGQNKWKVTLRYPGVTSYHNISMAKY